MAHVHIMVARLGVAATLLTTIPARADGGDTTDALPGVLRVPVVNPSARGLAVAASGGSPFKVPFPYLLRAIGKLTRGSCLRIACVSEQPSSDHEGGA